MMGYHNCPPHPLEPLDPEMDSYWLERAKAEAIEGLKRFKKRIEELNLRTLPPGGVRLKR